MIAPKTAPEGDPGGGVGRPIRNGQRNVSVARTRVSGATKLFSMLLPSEARRWRSAWITASRRVRTILLALTKRHDSMSAQVRGVEPLDGGCERGEVLSVLLAERRAVGAQPLSDGE